MIHKIKCPKCKFQFTVDTGDKIAGSEEMAICKCDQCGLPLINQNGTDNWELLKPSDMMKLPKELQVIIAEQLLPVEEISGIKSTFKMMQEAMASTTPMDRARIFLSLGVCNSEGCVLVLGPSEWGKFSALTNMHSSPVMRDALHHIITKDYEQKTEDN